MELPAGTDAYALQKAALEKALVFAPDTSFQYLIFLITTSGSTIALRPAPADVLFLQNPFKNILYLAAVVDCWINHIGENAHQV